MRKEPNPNRIIVQTFELGSRYLLKPSKQVNDLIAGVLAWAARLDPVAGIVFVAMSSHFTR